MGGCGATARRHSLLSLYCYLVYNHSDKQNLYMQTQKERQRCFRNTDALDCYSRS